MDEKPIRRFKDKFKFLGNKSKHVASYNARIYSSVDEAFQYAKENREEDKKPELHFLIPTRRVSPETWEGRQSREMIGILYSKFHMNIDARNTLLSTGNRSIINGSKAADVDLFWGYNISSGIGKNELGRLLEDVRFFIRYSKSKGCCIRCPAYVSCNESCDCMLRMYYGDNEFNINLERTQQSALSNNSYYCIMRGSAWDILTKKFRATYFDTYPIYFNPNKIWIDLEDLE